MSNGARAPSSPRTRRSYAKVGETRGGGLAGSVSLCAVPVFLPGWAAPVRTLPQSRDAPVKRDSERPGAGGVADRRIRLEAEVGRRARKRSDEEREGNVHVGETPSLA